MADSFQDITVTRFDANEGDQDPERRGVFHFKFKLSRPAPGLWIQIAEQEVGAGRVNHALQRLAEVYSTFITARCSAEQAQGIKDALNNQVLPAVNQRYREAAEAAKVREAAAREKQRAIMAGVDEAVRNQH
jgi:hypothetical protein